MTLLLRPRTDETAPSPPEPPAPTPSGTLYTARVFPSNAFTFRGQPITVTAEFMASGTSALADPPSVAFTYAVPAGQETFTTPDPRIVRERTGRYHVDIEPPGVGVCACQWFGPDITDVPDVNVQVLPRYD